MKWQRKHLAEVADFCLGKMLDQKKNRGEPLPYLANLNVRWGAFDLENLREMRFEPNEMDRYGLKYGDIVMCEGGEPGRCAIWRDAIPGMMFQKALHRIRAQSCIDYRFLYYALLYTGKLGGFGSLFTGSTIKHLPRQSLAKLEIDVPPRPTQERIADILSAHDELIDNNLRRMTLLGEAARQLYREWFVRLRFPGHEHVRVREGVPEGWEHCLLSDTCTSIEDGDWIETKDQGGDAFRLLQVSNIGVNEFVETGNLRFVDEQTFNRLNCREVNPGEILIARMPTPIGRAWLVPSMNWRMITAVDVAIAVPDTSRADELFLTHFLNSQGSPDHCERRAVGATRLRISRRELAQIPLVLPTRQIQFAFREFAEPLYRQRTLLYRQNEKLRAIRDLLLPRLMSGEFLV